MPIIQASCDSDVEPLKYKNTVYEGDIHGEEHGGISETYRPLYFGLKNIILKEIENIDADINVQEFFTG